MSKLLMISGFGARQVALKKQGAFFDTLQELRKHFDRIDILSPGKKWWFSKSKTVQIFDTVFIHISPLPLWLHPFWIKNKGTKLHKLYKYDLATVQEHPPFYNGMGARKLYKTVGLNYVLEIMHIPGYPRPADIKDRLYCWLTKKYIARDAKDAVAIRVINKTEVPEFLLRFGVEKSKINYIPAFYIDLEKYIPKQVVKEYDVIAIARLTENKGLILLLDALRILKNDFKAIIVGDGPLKKEIRQEIESCNLQDNVILAGWVSAEEKIDLIQKSRMLIMTSYNEGGPRVTLEAMACGVPIITTRVGIMIDIIKDKENGLFVDWNFNDIAQKINMLKQDKELQNTIISNALITVKQFEQKSAIKNYADGLKKFMMQS